MKSDSACRIKRPTRLPGKTIKISGLRGLRDLRDSKDFKGFRGLGEFRGLR